MVHDGLVHHLQICVSLKTPQEIKNLKNKQKSKFERLETCKISHTHGYAVISSWYVFFTKWRHTWPLLGAPAVLRDVEHSGVYTPNWNWVSPKTSAQAKILLLQIQHIRSIHIQGQGLHDIQRWSSPQREKDQKRCISGVYRFWWYEIQDTILVDLTCALSKEPDNLRSEECLRGGSCFLSFCRRRIVTVPLPFLLCVVYQNWVAPKSLGWEDMKPNYPKLILIPHIDTLQRNPENIAWFFKGLVQGPMHQDLHPSFQNLESGVGKWIGEV